MKSFLCIFRRNFEIIANMSARKWQNAANLMLLVFSLTNFARPFMSAFFDVALRWSIWHNTTGYWPEPSEFGVIKTLSARLMWGSHLVPLTCGGFSTLTPNLLPMAVAHVYFWGYNDRSSLSSAAPHKWSPVDGNFFAFQLGPVLADVGGSGSRWDMECLVTTAL